MPEPNSRRSIIQRRGLTGLSFRAIALLIIEAIALTLVFVLRWRDFYFSDVPANEVGLIFAALAFAMLLGLVFAELPTGDEHTFTRLGLATFCRTGLPLLVVLAISKYSVCLEKAQPIFVVVLFYAVGQFSVMILSTLPLRSRPS